MESRASKILRMATHSVCVGEETSDISIEILDDLGNTIKNIDELDVTTQQALKEHLVIMEPEENTNNSIPEKRGAQLSQNISQKEKSDDNFSDYYQDKNIVGKETLKNEKLTPDIMEHTQNQQNNTNSYNAPVQNQLETAQNEDESQEQEKLKEDKPKPRKRKINSMEWKSKARKKNCQAGEEYVNARGKLVKARRIENKKDCMLKCKFNCAKQISEHERNQVFNTYWSLTQNEKYVFLKKTTKKLIKVRKTTGDNASRRIYSFSYFIHVKGEDIRVCKQYFLGTLNISQKPVYTAHLEPNEFKKDNRGNRNKENPHKEEVKAHIGRFPVILSHYCRKETKRKYLEANLSVAKMYELYTKWCIDNNSTPATLSYYRYVFTTEFNYGFHIPKKDRCIKCESFKIKNEDNTLTVEEKDAYQKHLLLKEQMRIERNNDRETKIPTLCFDLENVITCPRSEVGDFFYSQKLNIYNLTGHFSTTGQIYCAIWTEAKQGRGGNILASAFRKILDQVLEDNNITDLVTWSDSCVSQNRNSFISFAVIDAIREHPELNSVTMKFSIPGHGTIQEVDNVHSNIERYMNKTEFYSPLSFIKNLKSVNKKKPYCIINMKDEYFKNFEACAKQLAFKKIPFSKVTSLRFTQSLSEVEYKLNYTDNFIKETLKHDRATARRNSGSQVPDEKTKNLVPKALILTLKPKAIPSKNSLSDDKIKAIKKMMSGCMPDLDKKYFTSFLNTLK